ncbi:hypothetical protein C7S18_10240 [Ahniella affigens]|uniref:Uncharacterized protein n=1 Tax=Ahniella affigens TaxID=2021234 RepID=A0A2P1PRT5_9GAMM|nr:hypothetical protein C7S18_10240 [Ahniella affigens]
MGASEFGNPRVCSEIGVRGFGLSHHFLGKSVEFMLELSVLGESSPLHSFSETRKSLNVFRGDAGLEWPAQSRARKCLTLDKRVSTGAGLVAGLKFQDGAS